MKNPFVINFLWLGTYQYLNRRDLGSFEVLVDETNPKRIYLYYKNMIPSGLAEGYEIWEKQ